MRVALRLTFLCLFACLFALVALTASAAEPPSAGPHVDVVAVRGVIDTVNSQYLSRSLDRAAADGAEAVIVLLDTPGGLDTSMRAMVQKIVASPVPVVVYISPSGARAGSAGLFLTLAADVAAMAPNTNLGAAHPVSAEGQMDEVMSEKVTNDAAAFARALAARHGRNEVWAEQAVRGSASITDREAVEARVVDFVAADLDDLLAKLDGREITSASGPRVLDTRGAAVWSLEMTLPERALHTLVDPNIAYLLLTIGVWALIAEFYHPGALVPGLTGVVCLVLAFVAFESLPMNWAGLALVALAMGLFIADVKTPTHGALTVGGVVCFVLGSLMLFSPLSPEAPALPDVRVSPAVIAGVTLCLLAFFLVALQAGLRAQRRPALISSNRLLGESGYARTALRPESQGGAVFVRGETWTAVSDEDAIAPGEAVEVTDVEGLRLHVRRLRALR
jgi:membrane-bound serine protease (ClpP class)